MSHVDDGQLNALLDGELDRDEKSQVEAHLAACRICRDRLEEARAFLIESGSLLEQLDVQGVQGVHKPGKTAKERGIEIPVPSKTAREPAINIDGQTARAAPSPFFPQAAERIAAQAGREAQAAEEAAKEEVRARRRARFGDVTQLAWAASIVLAIGVGFLSREVMIQRDRNARFANTDLGERTAQFADSQKQVAAVSERDLARSNAGAPTAGSGATGTRTTSTPSTPRTRLVKPPEQRGAAKPPEPGDIPLDPRARRDAQGRAEELAGASGPPTAAANDAISRVQAPPPAPAPLAAAERSQPTAPAAAAPSPQLGDAAANQQRAPQTAPRRTVTAPAAGAPAMAAAPSQPATFQRINADSAIRALSGAIRLVDGMRPGSIEIGPGYLVPGANPDRDVVRIHYQEANGRRLVLDQQPGEAGASVNGLMRGDTLITSAPAGGLRVRWVDRKNFWLSLTGPLTPEELRALVERIR